jgi:hypothetical protein
MKNLAAATLRRELTLLFALASAACSSSPATTDSGAAPVDAGKDVAESAMQDSGTGEGQASADTWSSYAQGFFQTYCVECHGASDPTGRDFTQYAVVKSNASTIRCGVCAMQVPAWACPATPVARQFPIADSTNSNPKPTDAERNRIVAWISAGAPQ